MISQETKTAITFRNILIATDFSAFSGTAFPYALDLARRFGSALHIVHVLAPEPYWLVPSDGYGMTPVFPLNPSSRTNAEAGLQRLVTWASSLAITPQTILCEGDAPAVISATIAERSIDLVVLATHGRTGLDRLAAGSVAETVLRSTSCPVFTVGPRTPSVGDGSAEIHEILFATDFSSHAAEVLHYALGLAHEYRASLTLLHVEPEDEGRFTFDRVMAGAALTQKLGRLVPADAELWSEPKFAVEFGAPAAGIVKAATDHKADLIVMGAHGAGAMLAAATHLFGGTAHTVVCQAPCPVLTVRR
ncbi:MAG: universal stress protein [Terriglobales bacterium]